MQDNGQFGSPNPTLRAPSKGRAALIRRPFYIGCRDRRPILIFGEKPAPFRGSACGRASMRTMRTMAAYERRRNPFEEARRFAAALNLPGVRTRSDVARALGVSRARAVQMLNLLRLPPAVTEWVAANWDSPEVRARCTERALRRVLACASPEDQLTAFHTDVMGTTSEPRKLAEAAV